MGHGSISNSFSKHVFQVSFRKNLATSKFFQYAVSVDERHLKARNVRTESTHRWVIWSDKLEPFKSIIASGYLLIPYTSGRPIGPTSCGKDSLDVHQASKYPRKKRNQNTSKMLCDKSYRCSSWCTFPQKPVLGLIECTTAASMHSRMHIKMCSKHNKNSASKSLQCCEYNSIPHPMYLLSNYKYRSTGMNTHPYLEG